MYIAKTTCAEVTHWTEYRTPSGRWSKVKHDIQTNNVTSLWIKNFLSIHVSGERRQYVYFREGYLPYRVTVPSSDGSERCVTTFSYYTKEEDWDVHED